MYTVRVGQVHPEAVIFKDHSMGCCCSCWGGGGEEENGSASSAAETELQAQNAEGDRKMLSIARGMSAPTIEVEDRTKVCMSMLLSFIYIYVYILSIRTHR